MKKYDSYKDSGIEWIGEIPEHWEVKKLKYVLNINSGEGINSEEIKPDGIYPVYGGNGVVGYTENYNSESKEIIIGRVGAKCGNVRLVSGAKWISDNALVANLMSNIDIHFLSIQMQNMDLNRMANQNAQPLITGTMVKEKEALFPTLQEQTAIAHYLDRKTAEIDELIADKKRLLELYEAEKTAIINQAVTKGINLEVPMKDSGIEWLGEVPAHWDTSPLKYLGKFINGFSFKSSDFVSTGVRVLKISNIQHMRIDWDDESFLSEIFYESYENFRVFENDLVFALTRPIISTGIKVALIDTSEPILLNQRNSIYRPTEINVKWVYYILLSSNFIQEFDSRIDKTGQQPNISSNDIGGIKITIPNEDEQNEIISFIDERCAEIESKKAKTEKLIDLITEYRTALISEVVTGKVKVIE